MSSSHNIKALIFDVGGVLVDYDNAADRQYWQRELGLSKELFDTLWADLVTLLGTGKLDETKFWEHASQKYGIRHIDVKEDLLKRSFTEVMKPHQEVIALVKTLKRKGFQLAILSDTIEPHARALAEAGIYSSFDFVVLSYKIGIRKPDPLAYKEVLNQMKAAPEKALFIDDRVDNVESAQNFGMHGIVAKNPKQVVQEVIHILQLNI